MLTAEIETGIKTFETKNFLKLLCVTYNNYCQVNQFPKIYTTFSSNINIKQYHTD